MSKKKHYPSGIVRRTFADGYPFTAPPSLRITKPQGILSEIWLENAQIDGTGQVEGTNEADLTLQPYLTLQKPRSQDYT